MAAPDQYATIPEKHHVIQNMVFSPKPVKAPEREAYDSTRVSY